MCRWPERMWFTSVRPSSADKTAQLSTVTEYPPVMLSIRFLLKTLYSLENWHKRCFGPEVRCTVQHLLAQLRQTSAFDTNSPGTAVVNEPTFVMCTEKTLCRVPLRGSSFVDFHIV